MEFTLGITQTGYPSDGDVLYEVDAVARLAHQRGVTLLVWPENLMHPHELLAQQTAALAESLDGPFARGVCRVAREQGLWMVFSLCEHNPSGGHPFNTAVVTDDQGQVQGVYRKCHLYDAHSVRESDQLTAGSALCAPVRTPFCTLGVGICYDLRFPEVARQLALRGCDLIVYPAAWHDGPHKALHWQTLLRARAIENECFVAGACHGGPRYVGVSHAFDPLGHSLVQGSDPLLTCTIDPQAVAAARDAMPVLDHRRPELYR